MYLKCGDGVSGDILYLNHRKDDLKDWLECSSGCMCVTGTPYLTCYQIRELLLRLLIFLKETNNVLYVSLAPGIAWREQGALSLGYNLNIALIIHAESCG